jgi:hypothetical protein
VIDLYGKSESGRDKSEGGLDKSEGGHGKSEGDVISLRVDVTQYAECSLRLGLSEGISRYLGLVPDSAIVGCDFDDLWHLRFGRRGIFMTFQLWRQRVEPYSEHFAHETRRGKRDSLN